MKHRLPPKAKSSSSALRGAGGMQQSELLVEEVHREDAPEASSGPGTPPSGETLPATDEAMEKEEKALEEGHGEGASSTEDSAGTSTDIPASEDSPTSDDHPMPTDNDGVEPTAPTAEAEEVAAQEAKEEEEDPFLEPTPAQEATVAPRRLPPPLPLINPAHKAPTHHPEPEEQVDYESFLIQTRGLVKQYGGRRVVNGVDIYVRPGEVVGLLGKNGAGKTTTFYMIVGLVAPTEGHVFMGDEDVTRMPMYRRARRGIGYLPQEESIFRKLSVEDNLLAILETLPLTEDERETRCDELLHDFGLEHVRQNIAITLSGGEKRRVTIARALVTSPTLLLLDEPFSGVDPMAVHDIQEIILHLKQRGLGVLITDHNVRETLSVVDRAYIIDEGRVLSEGSREFLLNDPIAREIYLGHRFSM